jgi:hypothetical protein
MMTMLINNIRYGVRQIRRSPGFSATVVLPMTLGVGANVVVFSVLNALVLKPLNLTNSERLLFLARSRSREVSLVVALPADREASI